jgi:hypothetical protein
LILESHHSPAGRALIPRRCGPVAERGPPVHAAFPSGVLRCASGIAGTGSPEAAARRGCLGANRPRGAGGSTWPRGSRGPRRPGWFVGPFRFPRRPRRERQGAGRTVSGFFLAGVPGCAGREIAAQGVQDAFPAPGRPGRTRLPRWAPGRPGGRRAGRSGASTA